MISPSNTQTIQRPSLSLLFSEPFRAVTELAGVTTKAEAFTVLAGMLSPANHPTPAGLAATRLYADLFQKVTSP